MITEAEAQELKEVKNIITDTANEVSRLKSKLERLEHYLSQAESIIDKATSKTISGL